MLGPLQLQEALWATLFSVAVTIFMVTSSHLEPRRRRQLWGASLVLDVLILMALLVRCVYCDLRPIPSNFHEIYVDGFDRIL